MHNEQMSILDTLIDERPFGQTSQITIQDERVVCLGLDNGNDAAKLTLLNSAGKLVSLRIPTAYQAARTFQGGRERPRITSTACLTSGSARRPSVTTAARCRLVRPHSACPTHASTAFLVPAWSRRS